MDESSQGTMEQARSQAQDVAGQVGEKAREGAAEAKSRAGEQVRQQVDSRSTQVGEQAQSLAQAMRRTGSELREQENDMPAKVLDAVADRVERLGSYLQEARAEELVDRVEDFARRQPWLVAAGGFVTGLIGSRVLKASSSDRYQRRTGPADRFSGSGRTPHESEYVTPRTEYIPPATPALPDVPPQTSASREPF